MSNKLSLPQVDQIINSVKAMGDVLGLTNPEISRAVKAIDQMIECGCIKSCELKGQLIEAGFCNAIPIMAESALQAGLIEKGERTVDSINNFITLVEEGKADSFKILPKFGQNLDHLLAQYA